MGRFVSGVSVVTALHGGVKHAMTATAVSSVSLDPPLVLVCVGRSSRFHPVIMDTDSWALSLLAGDQAAVARHFSNRARDLPSQFENIDHVPAPVSGAPLIEGAIAWIDCTTYARHDGGDHTIVLGRIVRASGPYDAEQAAGGPDGAAPGIDTPLAKGPLTYYQGAYWPPPTASRKSLP
jgi:flavin reductase (DIM6/NTAB) family NADH-FMN oxidoreductase RutF